MITRIIQWSIDNRPLVLLAAVVLSVAGIVSLKTTPLDAIPDLSDVQVIIKTNYEGQSPRVHDLKALAERSGLEMPPILLALQVYAVEARYEEGPFPLPADRAELLASIQQLLADCEHNAQS